MCSDYKLYTWGIELILPSSLCRKFSSLSNDCSSQIRGPRWKSRTLPAESTSSPATCPMDRESGGANHLSTSAISTSTVVNYLCHIYQHSVGYRITTMPTYEMQTISIISTSTVVCKITTYYTCQPLAFGLESAQ